jgi:hypothetical protein
MALIDTKDILAKVTAHIESHNPRRNTHLDFLKWEGQSDYVARIDEIINTMTVLELLVVLSELEPS